MTIGNENIKMHNFYYINLLLHTHNFQNMDIFYYLKGMFDRVSKGCLMFNTTCVIFHKIFVCLCL